VQSPAWVQRSDVISIGDFVVRNDKLLVVVAAVLMMVALDQFVNRTKLGRGIRATAQSPETAVLMGVNIDRIVTATFAIGGAMAGVAAALYLMRFEETNYFVGFLLGIKAFTAAVLGGIGNLRGALLGGLILGLIEMYGSAIFGSAWQNVIAFTVLVLVLMFRPTGILGESLQQARA
jgi:branched-chain amino acid transport system permease protein